jgi:hypothetical protein
MASVTHRCAAQTASTPTPQFQLPSTFVSLLETSLEFYFFLSIEKSPFALGERAEDESATKCHCDSSGGTRAYGPAKKLNFYHSLKSPRVFAVLCDAVGIFGSDMSA